MPLQENEVLYAPKFTAMSRNGVTALLAPDTPHWLNTDSRGEKILRSLDGRRSVGEIIQNYAADEACELLKARQHVRFFLEEALRKRFISRNPISTPHYLGRKEYLTLDSLRELWIHTNNSCNLACEHCLVSSSPEGDKGMPKEKLLDVMDRGAALGVERFYFTGGEPFVRNDIFELIAAATQKHGKELAVLSNGTLFKGERLEKLAAFSKEKLRQIGRASCRERV